MDTIQTLQNLLGQLKGKLNADPLDRLFEMPEAVKELDQAITDLALATGASQSQIDNYLDAYAKLSKQLGVSITDLTIAGKQWLKQGYSIAETKALIQSAVVLSKTGSMSLADATSYLASAMNGYRISAQDTLRIVDQLSAVDLASTVDAAGLAQAMGTIAVSADLAGVSMDRLLGYLASVGETAPGGLSQASSAFSDLFSRMGTIQTSQGDSFFHGEDLSGIETDLSNVGIHLRDAQDSFRDLDRVLDETAGKWSSFSASQQTSIASAFAGKQNMEEFILLMEHYDQALQYSEISMNSNGQAMKQFAVYQDSLAGHAETFEAAFIQLSNTLMESDFLKMITELGTDSLNILESVIDRFGSLTTLLPILGAALGGKNLGYAYIWIRR